VPLDSGDWVQDTANVTSTVTIIHNTSTPINGNRSVRFTVDTGGVGGSKGAGAIYLDAAKPHSLGFELGRIQTLIRVDNQVDQAGIYFLASQSSGIAGAGSAYAFGPSGSSSELVLTKLSTGLFDTTPQILISTGINMGVPPTSIKAIEVIWRASLSIFGGTFITVRAGDAINFGDLVDIGEIVDESAPLLTSEAEGLFCFRAGTTLTGQAVFDDTTVFETTIV
jgi:hypothetical protein